MKFFGTSIVAAATVLFAAEKTNGMNRKESVQTVELEDCSIDLVGVGTVFNHFYIRLDNGKKYTKVAGEFFDAQDKTTPLSCDVENGSDEVPEPAISQKLQNLGSEYSFEGKRRALAENRKLTFETTQSLRNLVLMIQYKDHADDDVPSNADFEVLFNSPTSDAELAPTGSVKTYYDKQSHGLLDITNVLSGWIKVNYTEAEAAGPCADEENCCNGACLQGEKLRDAIKEALVEFEEQIGAVEFAKFDQDQDGFVDMFTVVHSGKGAEHTGGEGVGNYWIWSHKWVLDIFNGPFATPLTGIKFWNYNVNPGLWHVGNDTVTNEDVQIGRLGVIAHEMAHFLFLLDHYDTDYSSNGVGPYDLMSNSWGIDGSQYYPSSLSAPSKMFLGWLSTVDLLSRDFIGPQFGGEYALDQVQTSGDAYIVRLTDKEYFLIENRQALDWDALLVGGCLVWHVDESKVSSGNRLEFNVTDPSSWADQHPLVRLVQPDGFYDLERPRTEPRGNVTRYRQDEGDWWPYQLPSGDFAELSDASVPLPNLNTYAKLGRKSGITVKNFSPSAPQMTFEFRFNVNEVATDAPTSSPTVAPSVSPTSSPEEQPLEDPSAGMVGIPVVAGVGAGALIFGAILSRYAGVLCSESDDDKEWYKNYTNGDVNPAYENESKGGPVVAGAV